MKDRTTIGRPLLSLSLVCLLLCSSANGDEVRKAAGSALSIMDTPQGAKAVGMGEAFSALADDNSAIYWNPAGLSQQVFPRLSLAHSRWFLDASFQELSLSWPLGLASLGAQLSYVNSGVFERRDEFGARLPGMIEPYQMG